MQEMVDTARSTTEELGKLEGMAEDERAQLFETIGMGALKYFLLKVDPKKRMLFDPAESIDFTGNTAPFIQYTYARTRSLLNRFDASVTAWNRDNVQLHDKERQVIAMLHDYPSVIQEAASNYSPALVANYAYELVKGFNQYYQAVPIITDTDSADTIAMRQALVYMLGGVVKSSMGLLGITVPNQM